MRSDYMIPDNALNNLATVSVSDRKKALDGHDRLSRGITLSNLHDLLLRESGPVMRFASMAAPPILLDCVGNIILSRALKKMARIEARRVIAMVKRHQESIKQRISQLHHKLMNAAGFIFEFKLAITGLMPSKWPFLAFIGLDLEGFEEPLIFRRGFVSIVPGHVSPPMADTFLGWGVNASQPVFILPQVLPCV